jgi:glycosyltransferase involved in cell wall biosynthesis
MKLSQDRAGISIIEGYIPNYRDMGRLYRSADCLVNPTRGEGWNLPLLESMACGVPGITTNWSAHTEFANKNNSYLLEDISMVPAIHPRQICQPFLQYGKWAEPTVKELRDKMRYAYENREETCKLGARAMIDAKKWTWMEAAKKAEKVLMQ